MLGDLRFRIEQANGLPIGYVGILYGALITFVVLGGFALFGGMAMFQAPLKGVDVQDRYQAKSFVPDWDGEPGTLRFGPRLAQMEQKVTAWKLDHPACETIRVLDLGTEWVLLYKGKDQSVP